MAELLAISQQFNFTDELLRKPVHYAAACEGPGPLKVLIENGADTREADRDKNTPLHFACRYGRLANVKLLISNTKYCNVLAKNKEGNAAIHLAA